jgi:TatD DNase family protein
VIFVDTHAHLNFDHFMRDLEPALDRALSAGVDRILLPGIDIETSRAVAKLCEKNDHLYAAVGFHPHDAIKWNSESKKQLKELVNNSKVIAIGEIGLDYYRENSPMEIQKFVFQSQLELAAESNLPLIIHNRNAFEDVWSILRKLKAQFPDAEFPSSLKSPGIFHAFNESLDIASRIISENFYLGIGGPATYRNALGLQKVIQSFSLDHFVLETDSPFLTPHPHRGERNEPSYIPLIAQKIADIKNCSLHEVASQTTANVDRIFNWSATFG